MPGVEASNYVGYIAMARAFEEARYSPASLRTGIAEQAEQDAKSIEEALGGARPSS